MELDERFFDSVDMEVVRKKYYDAGRVNALLDDIRQRAEDTNRENQELKAQLEKMNGKRSEIGDMFLEAQSMSREITDRAGEKADRLLKDARREADEIVSRARVRADEILKKAGAEADEIVAKAKAEAEKAKAELSLYPDQQEYSARCVEDCINKLKTFHLDAVDMLNEKWQEFLCGLYVPEDERRPATEPVKEPEKPAATLDDYFAATHADMENFLSSPPEQPAEEGLDLAELEAKIGAIVEEMNAMMDE